MKRIVSILVALIIALPVLSQSIIQKGVTYRYNGKNPRTPIGGVYIKPISADNGVVSDALNGSFSVVLKNLTMGSRIGNVRVTKQGMMVFNQMTVDEWSVRKQPLCLILCDANEFQKQKKNLIAIGEKEAKKKYERELARLKKKNESQQLQLDDYYNKLDSLENEYQNALKHMDEYADVFARIDESEIDTLAQCAVELFNKGEIEKSIRMLEKGNYMKKLDDALHTKSQAQKLRLMVDSVESLADKDIEEYIKNIKIQISQYKLVNDYRNAGDLLKGLADKLNSLETIGEYALFCYNQNLLEESEKYYNLYIEKAMVLSKNNPEIYEVKLASAQIDLGTLYKATNRYDECEKLYWQAIPVIERATRKNTVLYSSSLLQCANLLGNLYNDTKRYTESEKEFKEALQMCQKINEICPKIFEPIMSLTKLNLGYLYLNLQKFEESETMLKSGLEILEKYYYEPESNYNKEMVSFLYNLALLYKRTNRYRESEIMYKKALIISEKMTEVNHDAYLPRLAYIRYELADLYINLQEIDKSEQLFRESLLLYEQLVNEGKHEFKINMVFIWSHLFEIYLYKRNYQEAYSVGRLLLRAFFKMYNNQTVDKIPVVTHLNNLSFCSNLLKKYSEAENFAHKALKIDSTFHIAYTNLAASLLLQGRYEEAKSIYVKIRGQYKNGLISDIEELFSQKAIPKERNADVEKIIHLLNE